MIRPLDESAFVEVSVVMLVEILSLYAMSDCLCGQLMLGEYCSCLVATEWSGSTHRKSREVSDDCRRDRTGAAPYWVTE